MQWTLEISHSLWVSWIYTSSIIHKTSESFSYRNLFFCESMRFLTQLHEESCESLFCLWFCAPIPKFALILIKKCEKNIAPCQRLKEWESSTVFLAKFFSNFVDVAEPDWDCTDQKANTIQWKFSGSQQYALSDTTTSVSKVLTTHCFTPLDVICDWIMWPINFFQLFLQY